MSDEPAAHKNFPPPKVSGLYGLDWQFASRLIQAPTLRGATIMIAVAPFILDAASQVRALGVQFQPPWQFWFIWASAVCFGMAWTIQTLFCPQFIKQYRHFGDFQSAGHSHRWALWEIFNRLKATTSWEKLAAECIQKGLTVKADSRWEAFTARPNNRYTGDSREACFYEPVNRDRDLFIPLEFRGEKYFITVSETDADRDEKVREAFWLLFSHLARSGSFPRYTFWCFVGFAFFFGSIPILWNVLRVIIEIICG